MAGPIGYVLGNLAQTVLNANITTTPLAGTVETWQVASTASPFPQLTVGQQFHALVGPGIPSDPNPELVLVTATVDPYHFQVNRGAEGTLPKAHLAGDAFTLVWTWGSLQALLSAAKYDAASSPQISRAIPRVDSVVAWGRLWISELVRWSQRSQLTAPTPTATTAATGGTIAGGQTLGYRITALNANGGESPCGLAVRIAVPAGTNTNTVTVSWTAATAPNGVAATGYRIYGRGANDNPSDWDYVHGGFINSSPLATVGAVTSWTDTGAAVATGIGSAIDTTAAPLVVGEVGVPSGTTWDNDTPLWESAFEQFMWDCDANFLSTFYWDVNDQSNPNLSAYTRTSVPGNPRFPNYQAGDPNIVTSSGALYERHKDFPGFPYWYKSFVRGINVSNGSYGVPYAVASSTIYSNTRVDGTGGSRYFGFPVQTPQPPDGPVINNSQGWYNYGSAALFAFLASRGLSTVIIAISYERLFRTSDLIGSSATINATEGARLDAAITAAGNAGLKVILRAFGNGNYYLENATAGAGINQAVNHAQAITAMTNSGTTVTATVGSTAQMVAGQSIQVTGASGSNVNGTWTVASVLNGTQFTFVVSSTPVGASGGSVYTYTNTAYANFWSKIATRYNANATVTGYSFDNEPPGYNSLPSLSEWQGATQAALNAIRAVDTTRMIYIPIWPESGGDPNSNMSNGGWISDSTGKFAYSAHFYYDNTGNYTATYKSLNQSIATSSSQTAVGTVAIDDPYLAASNVWLRANLLPGLTSGDPQMILFSGDDTQAYILKSQSSDHDLHIQGNNNTDLVLINNTGALIAVNSGAALVTQDRTLGANHQWWHYASGGTWAIFNGANMVSMVEGVWDFNILVGNLDIQTVGKGVMVKEGTNAKQGTATLVAGTATVANTSVTANSRIFLTIQSPGGTVGSVYVNARTAGTSFTIKSTSTTDTSTVAYEIFEPG